MSLFDEPTGKIASVLLPKPLPEPFDYAIPADMQLAPGMFVRVPLGPRSVTGVVWAVKPGPPKRPLKAVEALIATAPSMPGVLRDFVDRVARYVVSPPGNVLAMCMRSREALLPSPVEKFITRGQGETGRMTPARLKVMDALTGIEGQGAHLVTAADLARLADVSAGVVKGLVDAGGLRQVELDADPPFDAPNPEGEGFELTADQLAAAQTLRDSVKARDFRPVLLDGITGSGKTEVYFEAIAEVLRGQPEGQILVLLPEIALTQAVRERFARRFGAMPAEWHSNMSAKERRRTWREVAFGRARIVVGARSALFLPFPRLRLIVVDEEHDGSYKQDEGVCYQGRDLAVMRAQLGKAAVVLASATPSLETVANAHAGRYGRVVLKARPGVAVLPDISIANMRETPPDKDSWLSPPLVKALEENIASGEQSLLYLNRRGYAPLVICKSCGERLKAPDTESWLTEHRYSNMLVCHLTGYMMKKPEHCPHCGAKDALTGVGPGVERLAEEARARFSTARVEVFSSDTAGSPEALADIVARMEQGEIDILIGTQIAAKGHNFPRLTLVGAVDADAGLKGAQGSDLRAGERTFQLLSQVSGRAGRADRPGRAIIQTWAPDSPAIHALAAGDRDAFMELEMGNREMMGLPPYGRLAAVVIAAEHSMAADEAANSFVAGAPNAEGVEIWGPAPAPIAVLRGRHRRRLLVRTERGVDLSGYMAVWRKRVKLSASVRVTIDIEPYSFM
ncbi:MAG: primosomal protein N' [Hirschia sp.]|nr:primosomal protein N' [Hirschia sp.]MBF17590.1 primosomal protein N' [Hirschia sp.]